VEKRNGEREVVRNTTFYKGRAEAFPASKVHKQCWLVLVKIPSECR
jgi:hypothetical protein